MLLLLVCAGAIYVACEWFVNAVEWLGARLEVGHVAVGSILAAVGTALPESVVTLVAVLFGGHGSGDDIAVGAALGGPLVVGTIAYAVTGGMLVLTRRRRSAAEAALVAEAAVSSAMVSVGGSGRPTTASEPVRTSRVDTDRLARDQTWFLVIFTAKMALGLVAFAFKPWLGVLFFVAYGVYAYREFTGGGEAATEEGLEPLRLQRRRTNPTTVAVVAQTLGSLAVIFAASQLFVRQLEWAGPALGLSSVVVALLLAPIATELPEILNAVIWVRQGKTELALSNISGSMMIQATVPSGIGILATSWHFGAPLIIAGVMTMASVTYVLVLLRTHRVTPWLLTLCSGFYGLFAIGLVVVT